MVAPLGGDWNKKTINAHHEIIIVIKPLTSSITLQIWKMHWVMASPVPDSVTALSVELGNISLATWIDAPVTSLISLILDPPFPINEPHWLAGTMSRRLIGGRGTPLPLLELSWNWEHHCVGERKLTTTFRGKRYKLPSSWVVGVCEEAK